MASTDPSQRVALDGSAQDAHESLTRTKQDTSNVDPVVRAAAPQHPEPDDSKRPTSAAAAAPAAAGAAESTSSSSRSASAGLDSKQLGRLQRVANPRTVWFSEAGDFTPWLAQNIDVLAEALGLTLTVTATEVSVGDFRLDILAETDDGRVVVIENQLERTDHGHLGQCLVYASGLEASAVVWVAPVFRDEFRRSFDWLNERTDSRVNFFGVEIGVVQIGETGPRAPVFDVVARPNDWQKHVRPVMIDTVNPANAARQDFFLAVLASVAEKRPSIRVPSRQRANWLSFASGPFGYWSIAITADSRVRLEAYIDTGETAINKRIYDSFYSRQAYWDAKFNFPLAWERLDARKASRIGAYQDVAWDDGQSRRKAEQWAVGALISMYDELNQALRSKAAELRSAVTLGEDAFVPVAHDEDPDSDSIEPGLRL